MPSGCHGLRGSSSRTQPRPLGRSWQEALAQSRYAIGEENFVEQVESELSRRSGGDRDRDVDLPRAYVGLEQIDEVVAAHFAIPAEMLYRHGRSAGPAKAVAVELAVRLTGLSQREIGAHYGELSGQAVSMIRRRRRDAGDQGGRLEALPRELEKARKMSGSGKSE